MKFGRIAISIAGLISVSAFAQSSVTLYGTIDTAVAYFSNQKGTHG